MANAAQTASALLATELHHGDPHMIDYTPSGNAVKGGDVIAINAKAVGVAHNDIADGELGALAYPGGQATYRVRLATAATFSFGDICMITPGLDGTAEAAAGGTHVFGYVVGPDVDQGAGDVFVIATHDKEAGGA